jgi:hypothetical protein
LDTSILLSNLTNPTLLYFLLGVVAVLVRSDLRVPESTSRFLSLYLLFSIGFKGGQELAHSGFTPVIGWTLLLAVALACAVPLAAFLVLRRTMSVHDAGAVAATYGSVSAVTFITASGFLEAQEVHYGGHMVAAMALMEAPAIIIGVMLIRWSEPDAGPVIGSEGGLGEAPEAHGLLGIVREALTNGSVLMIVGSLVIGLVADTRQAEGIKPFTSDIFKGFLAVFLLEMGMLAAGRFKAFLRQGWSATVFALLAPPLAGTVAVLASALVPGMEQGDRFLLAILAASASYIAVPAALRLAVPKADPGLYIPMALGVTFPFNITVGIPLYWWLVNTL